MAKIYILFSHTLLQEQKQELKNNFLCDEIIFLPSKLQSLWSNIKEEDDYFLLFCDFLKENAQKNDYVLVQGEWGITYKIVNFCFKEGFIPVYSFSKRAAYEEVKEGTVIKTSYFKHIKFKKYEIS